MRVIKARVQETRKGPMRGKGSVHTYEMKWRENTAGMGSSMMRERVCPGKRKD